MMPEELEVGLDPQGMANLLTWSAAQMGCARGGPPHPPFGHLLPGGELGGRG
jgi:hypothetical protein